MGVPGQAPSNRKNAASQVSGSSLTHAIGDEPWSPHDVSRTMTTVLRYKGFRQERIALILDHNDGGGSVIEEHYDANEDLPEKRTMPEAWWEIFEGRETIDEAVVFKSRRPRPKTRRFRPTDA